MKSYLFSLIAAAFLAALASQLSPEGERGGISRHVRFVASLFLICVLLSPLKELLQQLPDLLNGGWRPNAETSEEESDYLEQWQESINRASADYFTDMLTQTLCAQLSVPQDNLQCKVFWDNTEQELIPTKVAVTLSGKAIWKDPAEIRALVNALIACPCDVIIQ